MTDREIIDTLAAVSASNNRGNAPDNNLLTRCETSLDGRSSDFAEAARTVIGRLRKGAAA